MAVSMFRRAIGAILLLATSTEFPAHSDGPTPVKLPSDHRRVMYYLDEAGVEQPVRTVEDWSKRRKQILAGMQRAMGPLPDRTNLPPLDVRVSEEMEGDGFTRLKLSFAAEGTDRIPAYLFLPTEREGRAPAVLCLHQTTNLGKAEPAGAGDLPNLHYALELAQRGYVVLAPDYPSFGDYQYDFLADDYVSGTMKGIFNHMRCVDLLQARDEVDPARIGVIGHSLGGHNSMFVATFDERIKVVVSSCGWTPFHDYYGGKIAGWTSDRYMPRLKDEYGLDADRVPFDFYEVVAAFAPRAFFSCSPLRDSNFDVAGVQKAIPVAAEVYKLLDAEDQLQVRYPDCEHDFPDETREEAYEFIDRVLEFSPAVAAEVR
jgi:dienelactone hydrolase